jgi:hypothetical protein
MLDNQATIRSVQLRLAGTTPPTAVQAAGFRFVLTNGTLGETGFNLDGNLVVEPKESNPTALNFTGLRVGHTADGASAYGGTFTLPDNGMDVFKTVAIKPQDDKPLTFGVAADKPEVFLVKGMAALVLPLIGEKINAAKVKLKSIEVRSDRNFEALLQPDMPKAKFLGSLATIYLTGLEFNTVGNVDIRVNGGVQLTLPLVQASVGGIRYRPGPGGPIVSVDSLGITVPIPVGAMTGYVHYKEVKQLVDGQAGSKTSLGGGLSINITRFVNLRAAFNYTNSQAGSTTYNEYSADFFSRMPPVLIGPGVALTGIGGGLTYRDDRGISSVRLSGSLSNMVAYKIGPELDPITLAIGPGPVINGTANLKLASKDVGQVGLSIDYPNALVSVSINSAIQVVPNLDTPSVSAILTISGAKDNSYWGFQATAKARMIGLIDVNAKIIMGENYNLMKTMQYLNGDYNWVDRDYLDDNGY